MKTTWNIIKTETGKKKKKRRKGRHISPIYQW
jgi:hypothetical protein